MTSRRHFLSLSGIGQPFIGSTVANAVDAATSKLVVQGQAPRVLTEAASANVAHISRLIAGADGHQAEHRLELAEAWAERARGEHGRRP